MRWCPNSNPLFISGVAQLLGQFSKVKPHADVKVKVATEDMEQAEYLRLSKAHSGAPGQQGVLRSEDTPTW